MHDKLDEEALIRGLCDPWTCVRCKRTFYPTPDDPASFSWGFQSEDVKMSNGDYHRRWVGDLCKSCMEGKLNGRSGN